MLALGETAALGAFCAQDLALFVLFFDLMLIPFYFLIGIWGPAPDRVRATTTFVIYTLVGSLLMLAAAAATGILATPHGGEHDVRAVRAGAAAAVGGQPGLDLPVLRARVPGEDAGLPAARMDAGRLPQRADAGGRRALGRAVEGRRVRLPADLPAAVPGRRGAVTRSCCW